MDFKGPWNTEKYWQPPSGFSKYLVVASSLVKGLGGGGGRFVPPLGNKANEETVTDLTGVSILGVRDP